LKSSQEKKLSILIPSTSTKKFPNFGIRELWFIFFFKHFVQSKYSSKIGNSRPTRQLFHALLPRRPGIMSPRRAAAAPPSFPFQQRPVRALLQRCLSHFLLSSRPTSAMAAPERCTLTGPSKARRHVVSSSGKAPPRRAVGSSAPRS
jgi:hypothetical protein